MPKYKIDLVQTIYEGATVYVDADSQQEAEDKVYAMLEQTNNPPQIEWKFADAQNDAEITCVEEYDPPPHVLDEPPLPQIDGVHVVEFDRNDPEGTVINLMNALRATIKED